MNESIYNLVPREYVTYNSPADSPKARRRPKAPQHKPLYGSTFGCHGSTKPIGAGVVQKKSGALYGPKADWEDKTKTSTTSQKPFHYEDRRLPEVPDRSDKPVLGIRTNKNFITANAVQAILQVPRIVDKGEENYLEKEDYGKVPSYLNDVKEEIRREKDMIDRYVKEQMGIEDAVPEQFDELDEKERSALILKLKEKWAHLNAKYQMGTHLVSLDTAGQVRRKEQLEQALTQVEHDIEKLSRGSNVLIRRDQY